MIYHHVLYRDRLSMTYKTAEDSIKALKYDQKEQLIDFILYMVYRGQI